MGEVRNKNVILKKGWKETAKYGVGMKQKVIIFQNFINNSTSQIVYSVSYHLMILLLYCNANTCSKFFFLMKAIK